MKRVLGNHPTDAGLAFSSLTDVRIPSKFEDSVVATALGLHISPGKGCGIGIELLSAAGYLGI